MIWQPTPVHLPLVLLRGPLSVVEPASEDPDLARQDLIDQSMFLPAGVPG